MSSTPLSAEASELLRVVARAEEADGRSGIDSEQAGALVAEALRDSGTAQQVTSRPPWFGLEEPARELEAFGLIDVDPGLASAVPPGQPAEYSDVLYFDLMVDRLAETVNELDVTGQASRKVTRNIDEGGTVIPWTVVSIDVHRDRETVLVRGEGRTHREALAEAYIEARRS